MISGTRSGTTLLTWLCMQAIPRWNSGRMEGVGWRVWGSRPFFFLKFPVFDCQESLSLLDRDGKQRPVGVVVEYDAVVEKSGVRDWHLTHSFFFLKFRVTRSRTTLFSPSNHTQRPVGVEVEWKTMVWESGVRDRDGILYFFHGNDFWSSFKNHSLDLILFASNPSME